MNIDVFAKFNSNLPPIAPQNIGTTPNVMPTLMDIEPDFFSSDNGKMATNTGVVLALGLSIRNILKKLTDGFFARYFSRKQNIDEKEMKSITTNMLKDKKMMEKPCTSIEYYTDASFAEILKNTPKTKGKLKKIIISPRGDDAFFNHVDNYIKVTKNTLISLPHEIGHAVQEHSTKLLKRLQLMRGKNAQLALLLYGLGRAKPADNSNQSFFGKIQNFLYKYNVLIPLLVFAPELITEFMASKIGIDSIKKHITNLKTNTTKNNKSIINSEKILKTAKKHYAIAFCTYLSLPLFAVLDNLIFQKASKN